MFSTCVHFIDIIVSRTCYNLRACSSTVLARGGGLRRRVGESLLALCDFTMRFRNIVCCALLVACLVSDPSRAGDAAGAAPEADDDASTLNSDSFIGLAVIFTGVGVVAKQCQLCGSWSTDQSPIPGELDDEFGGGFPWDKYAKVSDLYKKARGKLCRICRNVWQIGGYKDEWKGIKAYKDWTLKEDTATRHHPFMRCRARYVAKCNTGAKKVCGEELKHERTVTRTEKRRPQKQTGSEFHRTPTVEGT